MRTSRQVVHIVKFSAPLEVYRRSTHVENYHIRTNVAHVKVGQRASGLPIECASLPYSLDREELGKGKIRACCGTRTNFQAMGSDGLMLDL
jgi:hypothetical protein